MAHFPDAVFSNSYNSASQAGGSDSEEAFISLRARMRFHLLTHRTIVIPDTHLFDGELLLAQGPDVLQTALGGDSALPLSRIVIKARSGSLHESLADLLVARTEHGLNRSALNPFRFKAYFKSKDSKEIADAIGRESPKTLDLYTRGRNDDVSGGVAKFLRSVGGGSGTEAIDRLENGWRRWLEAEDQGRLTIKPWEGVYHKLLGTTLVKGGVEPYLTRGVETTFAEIVRLTDAGQSAKALVDNLFDRMDGLEEGDPEKKALMALRRYYELCRHRQLHGSTRRRTCGVSKSPNRSTDQRLKPRPPQRLCRA